AGEAVADLEHLAQLLEREVERLHLLDEQQAFHCVLAVEAEPARAALLHGDKPDLLIVADRSVAEAGALGNVADLHQAGVRDGAGVVGHVPASLVSETTPAMVV